MTSSTPRTFSIEYEMDAIQPGSLILGSRVRTGIRILANSRCLTDPHGKFTVGDFLPYNCTKFLRGIGPLLNGEPHLVRFTDTVCDVEFTPGDAGVVMVNAYGMDGVPRNPAIEGDGIAVDVDAVVREIVGVGRWVRAEFDNLEATGSNDFEELVEELVEAESLLQDADNDP